MLPTAIVVRAAAVTEAQGCGKGAGQVLRYAAVVTGCEERAEDGACVRRVPLTAGVFDCFADATFVELPAVGGTFSYDVDVFLYNEPGAAASRAALDDATARARANDPAGAESALRATSPTWSTTCTATQVDRVQSAATCAPVKSGRGAVGGEPLGESVVEIPLGTFPRAEGAPATCGFDYVAARAAVKIDGQAAAAVPEQPCADPTTNAPTPIVIRGAQPSATYEIALELLGLGGVRGLGTTCRASTSPGLTSSAVCDPVR